MNSFERDNFSSFDDIHKQSDDNIEQGKEASAEETRKIGATTLSSYGPNGIYVERYISEEETPIQPGNPDIQPSQAEADSTSVVYELEGVEWHNKPNQATPTQVESSNTSPESTDAGNEVEKADPYTPEQTRDAAKKNKGAKAPINKAAVIAAATAIVGLSMIGTAVASIANKDAVTLDKPEKTTVSGELQNGVTYDYSHYADRDKKESYNAYDYDQSERFGDREATIEGIMEVAKRTPEALASYAYDLLTDEEKAELGIDGMTMAEIDDRMSNSENGGELQQSLLKKVESILRSEKTSYRYYHENDIESTNYIYFVDDNHDGTMTPEELHLGYDTCKRNGAPQVDVSRKLYKTSKKTYTVKMLDLNYQCGFQPNYEEGEVPEGVPHISANSKDVPNTTPTTETESTSSTKPTKSTEPTTTQPTEWGKSGNPHGGSDVNYSDKVNPNSEVPKDQNENTNQGNQGYKDDGKAAPGSGSQNNNNDRLSGGSNQGGNQTNGQNGYHSPEQNSQGQQTDNSGNAAQQAAQESGGENGNGASAGGNNYGDAGEENPNNW